jgi:hypothetical protein
MLWFIIFKSSEIEEYFFRDSLEIEGYFRRRRRRRGTLFRCNNHSHNITMTLVVSQSSSCRKDDDQQQQNVRVGQSYSSPGCQLKVVSALV